MIYLYTYKEKIYNIIIMGKNKKQNNFNQNQTGNNNGQLQANNNNQHQEAVFVQTVLMRTITEDEYQNLKKENLDLQAKFLSITHNERLLQETINNSKILTEEKNQLKEENDRLREENKILREKIKELEEKNKSLEEHINDQNKRISVTEQDIKELKNRDDPITIREGIITLEKYIMMDVLDSDFSSTKARKIQGTYNLFNDPTYQKKCEVFLKKHGLTEDHINLIPDLKENGNKSAHERPDISRSEFEKNALLTFNDKNDKKMTTELLKYFESKNPVDPTSGLWIIKKPY